MTDEERRFSTPPGCGLAKTGIRLAELDGGHELWLDSDDIWLWGVYSSPLALGSRWQATCALMDIVEEEQQGYLTRAILTLMEPILRPRMLLPFLTSPSAECRREALRWVPRVRSQ